MRRTSLQKLLIVLLLCSTFALAACETIVLTDISEKDANDAVAHLTQQGIAAQKSPGQKGLFSVLVDEADFAQSVNALAAEGIPKDHYDTMGNIFKKEGVVSTPLEENARLIYALSQEVAGSIALINGVVAARVHVVLPTADAFGATNAPSSAAVFIKHRYGIPIENEVSRIKKLVENSIQGLKYEDISVFLFAAPPQQKSEKSPWTTVLGIKVAHGSAALVWALILALGACLGCGIGFVFWQKYGKKHFVKPE